MTTFGEGNVPLTGYDEFLVHQSSGPFTQVPSTDYAWDDGLFFAIYDVERDIHVFGGLRVNPNSGMIGGYAGVVHNGLQRTVRFKRPWGPHFAEEDLSLQVGPFRYAVNVPFKELSLTLVENGSGLTFDLTWEAIAEPVVEPHRLFRTRGRATTDQTRYLQSGTAKGLVTFDGEEVEIRRYEAFAVRDHSWGLYYERPPLAPRRKWLRPNSTKPQSFRLWVVFGSVEASGAFQVHESADGAETTVNDVLSVPFTGHLHVKRVDRHVQLTSGRHELEFAQGTRLMTKGRVTLVDDEGGEWLMEFDQGMDPFLAQPSGYAIGSWKDGGNISSYPGTDEPAVEWDEFNVAAQPCEQPIYGQNKTVLGIGTEYAFTTRLTAPDGEVFNGQSYVELMVNGRYNRYDFADDSPTEWLNLYHLMDE